MDKPVEISLGNLLSNSKNFKFLQEQGMQLIRQLASSTWTDHNVHDPGITLLETLCHGITEAGMQAGAASASDTTEEINKFIANLLTNSQQHSPQEFFTCSQVLPSSPVSLVDFQKVLMDHQLIERAWISSLEGNPKGYLSVLQQFTTRIDPVVDSYVNISGTNYIINFIFPQSNDPLSQPLQSDLLLQTVSFSNSFGPWQQIANTNSYSDLITVRYTTFSNPTQTSIFQLPVLLQITTPLVDAADLPEVLSESANLLSLLGDNGDLDLSILKQYNRRLMHSGDDYNDLNSNILRSEVDVSGNPYEIEIAFPYWDDPESDPFQDDVLITDLVYNPDLSNPWLPISGTDSYFTFLSFLGNGNSVSWPLVLRIIGSAAGLNSTIRDSILQAAANDLITPSPNPSLLKKYNRKVMAAFESSHRVRSHLKNYRNLCESFSEFRSVRHQEIAISCTIEMGAGTDIESLLANIFYSVYQFISPKIKPQSLSDLKSQLPTEFIFEGPLLKNGFIQDSQFGSDPTSNILYVSDIIRLIMRMGTGSDIQIREVEENRPVISVSNLSLSLYLDNRSITIGARDCMQLIDSSRHIARLSLEKCNITVTRNNTVVSYDSGKVFRLYYGKITLSNLGIARSPDGPSDIPIPLGESFATSVYYSIQYDLPVTYGVGKGRLPASSSPQRKGQAKQLQGYLFLFEQVLSGYFTQLAHINALFSATPSESTTLHQLPLYNVPAASDLLLPGSGYSTWEDFINDEDNPYMQVLKTGTETEEQFLTRRHQMLDHLLGRLGEDMQAFSSLVYRQSYSHPTDSTLSASTDLLRHKADYYYALPRLEMSRAQAYGHPAWRNNEIITVTPFSDGSFFLWQILDENGNILFRQSVPETSKTFAEETAEAAITLATSISNYYTEVDSNGLQRLALRWSAEAPSIALSNLTYATAAQAENNIPILQQSVLNLWLKYSLSSFEARLYHLLGIEIKKERRQLVTPTSIKEGFYIIEHLLLYPVTTGETALIIPDSSSSCLPVSSSGVSYALPNDHYSFILTIVFPSGYSRDFSDTGISALKQEAQPERFRDPEFRQYAEQTIRKFCPAHILPLVVWIDTALSGSDLLNSLGQSYPCFDNLESTYMAWLSVFFTDEATPSDISPLRNSLVGVLNSIYSESN